MTDQRVQTFEIVGGEARRHGPAAARLADVSAVLPAGSYTTLRTYRNLSVVRLARHLERLEQSVGMPAGTLDPMVVRPGLARAVGEAGHAESRVRLTFAPPQLFASVEPFVAPPESLYRDGAWCVTLPLVRGNPRAKDTRFLGVAEEARRRLPQGVHEGLLVAEDGALLEGLSSNVFAVHQGRLCTEKERVLEGVTREMVLEVAKGLLPQGEGAVHLSDVPEIAESFLTSVPRAIMPVARIDDHLVGTGGPGPITRELMARFQALLLREAEPLGA